MGARQMREIPIADFLNAMGIHPTKQKGNALWYSAPYRMERRPSFKVDINRNVWFDFGIGKGGDIFDLAGEFIGSKDFLLRAAFIARNGAYPLPIIEHPQRNEEKEPVFNDIWVRPLQDALQLAVLSYNVSAGRLLGYGKHPKSRLLRKIESGDRNFYREFVSFCRYKGKVLQGLVKRRKVEFALFYIP